MNPAVAERKPKILIVTGVLWVGGGAEKVAANLGNYLVDEGYETHLLTFYEDDNKYPFRGTYYTLNEKPPRSRLYKIWGIPLRVWRIARYIKKHDIDMAVSFLEEANFYTLVAKLLFVRRLPVVVSVRNNINKRGWLFKILTKHLYPYAKRVVSVTKAIEEILKKEYHLTNTTTIYNPIDTELVKKKTAEPLPTEWQWLKDRSYVAISIGRLTHQKGQWHLIRAFSEVVKKFPEAILVIVGEGEYREKLLKLISDSGLTDNVFLAGKHNNVYPFLATADVFVFSSLYEGMPNTMLEAYSVGLPIISPDCVSGPREIIAPDLKIDEDIEYPHSTKYGMLIQPMENEEIWKPVQDVLLTKAEEELAQQIYERLTESAIKPETQTLISSFEIKPINQQWERLIM